MIDIAAGSLVKHTSLGIGKVVAVEPSALHVFFPASAKRYAAKLRWPVVRPLLSNDGLERDEWLEGLTSFSLDHESGRYALASSFVTHEQAATEFLKSYPGGFADPAFVAQAGAKRGRAARWRAASAKWAEDLGGGQGERLLEDGDIREVARRALRACDQVRGLAGWFETGALEEAFEPGDVVLGFFQALFGVLSAPTRPRFEKLFAASEALGIKPDAAWALATAFPFVADPTRHPVLLPRSTCGAAARLGCDLRFKPAPNWSTYSAFRGLSERLLDSLRARGAKDFVDVEVFLHTLSAKRPSAPAAERHPNDPPASTSSSAKAVREGGSRTSPRRKK